MTPIEFSCDHNWIITGRNRPSSTFPGCGGTPLKTAIIFILWQLVRAETILHPNGASPTCSLLTVLSSSNGHLRFNSAAGRHQNFYKDKLWEVVWRKQFHFRRRGGGVTIPDRHRVDADKMQPPSQNTWKKKRREEREREREREKRNVWDEHQTAMAVAAFVFGSLSPGGCGFFSTVEHVPMSRVPFTGTHLPPASNNRYSATGCSSLAVQYRKKSSKTHWPVR